MSRIIDNLIAFRILSMMVTKFEDTEAFKLGIIDKNGKILRKSNSLVNSQERDAYTYLNRLVFNMKRIVNKVGGESRLKSLVAALWLVKESYESSSRSTTITEDNYIKLIKMMDNNCSLVEEEIIVNKFLSEDGAVVTNVTGAAVSTDKPVINKKNIKKYQVMNRRAIPIK
jgi:hypothetical protein